MCRNWGFHVHLIPAVPFYLLNIPSVGSHFPGHLGTIHTSLHAHVSVKHCVSWSFLLPLFSLSSVIFKTFLVFSYYT